MRFFAFVLALSLVSCTTFRESRQEKAEPAPKAQPAPKQGSSFADKLKMFQSMGDNAQAMADGDALGALGTLAAAAEAYHRPQPDYTPAQEYFLGRTVAAQLIAVTPIWDDAAATRYLNLLGQSLAKYSDDPVAWVGFRFAILDSPEINSYSAPGGFVFVTRGLLKLVKDEDQLAAVLAHEIAHVELRHGVRAIQKDQQVAATQEVFRKKREESGRVSAEESAAFKGTTGGLFRSMLNNSFSRDLEKEADAAAADILTSAGYPPQALMKVLQELQKVEGGPAANVDRTHLSPARRIADLRRDIGWQKAYSVSFTQKRRFDAAFGRI